jgi:hypothetical protein
MSAASKISACAKVLGRKFLWALTVGAPLAFAQQMPPGATGTQHGKVTNLESKDNLKSFHHLDCIDVGALTTDDSPADMYPAVRTCINRGDFQRAARLFAVAGAYGRFDTLRVNDVSAHQALQVLQLNNFQDLSPDAREKFQATVKEIIASDRMADLCAQARKLGGPSYYPTYMTQHGMSAFTGKGGGLKEDFKPAEAWESSLTGYLHCPAR